MRQARIAARIDQNREHMLNVRISPSRTFKLLLSQLPSLRRQTPWLEVRNPRTVDMRLLTFVSRAALLAERAEGSLTGATVSSMFHLALRQGTRCASSLTSQIVARTLEPNSKQVRSRSLRRQHDSTRASHNAGARCAAGGDRNLGSRRRSHCAIEPLVVLVQVRNRLAQLLCAKLHFFLMLLLDQVDLRTQMPWARRATPQSTETTTRHAPRVAWPRTASQAGCWKPWRRQCS